MIICWCEFVCKKFSLQYHAKSRGIVLFVYLSFCLSVCLHVCVSVSLRLLFLRISFPAVVQLPPHFGMLFNYLLPAAAERQNDQHFQAASCVVSQLCEAYQGPP